MTYLAHKHGYLGRVYWKGTVYTRFFACRKYGVLTARAKARRFVLQTERALGKPRSHHYVYPHARRWAR